MGMGSSLRERPRLFVLLVAALVLAATRVAVASTSSSSSRSAIAAFNRLPSSDFPGTVSRNRFGEHGMLKFQIRFMGIPVTLMASAANTAGGDVGTLSRTGSAFVLRFTHLSYRVDPVRLPDGLTIASQTINLDPGAVNTLHWSRDTGVATSDMHWVVDAPNTLYNGSHTIKFVDHGTRKFASFKRLGYGRFGFEILSVWHGSVRLEDWRVSGTALAGGEVSITGTWTGAYVLTVKGA
jgi:hypothetical protein